MTVVNLIQKAGKVFSVEALKTRTEIAILNKHDGVSPHACPLAGDLCVSPICQSVPDVRHGSMRRVVTLQRGEQLTMSNASCSRIWVVLHGMVAICCGLADGRRQIVELETSGNVVCGPASVDGSENWLEAMSDCTICELNLDGGTGPFENYPGLSSDMFGLIHERLRENMSRLVTLGRLDSYERVAQFFYEMAVKTGQNRDKGVWVPLPMTREDIADYLGINTETVSRIISRLKKAGLVKLEGRTAFVVADMAALQRRTPVVHQSHEDAAPSRPKGGVCPAHVKEAVHDR
jgi:CRP/FNR family transcriptional regulator